MNTNTNDTITLDDLRSRATVSVTEAAQVLGISRAAAYGMARNGKLPTVDLDGRRRRVKSAALLAMLAD
ncbi:helix-turn-helix domain-containing protein [Rhodococcus zopfii]